MKSLLLAAIAVMTFASTAAAQQPGLYKGSITVVRENKALNVKDTTTLLIRGELYFEPYSGITTLLWTATNFDPLSKLSNSWCRKGFYPFNPGIQEVGDMTLSGTDIRIPGGSVVPGTMKLTDKSIAWKTTKSIGVGGMYSRPTTVTTTFSFVRYGDAPPP